MISQFDCWVWSVDAVLVKVPGAYIYGCLLVSWLLGVALDVVAVRRALIANVHNTCT